MQVDREDLDSIFSNERDGKPFKVRYGVNGFGDKAVLFAKEGLDGKRFVALQDAREVDQQEHEGLWDWQAESSHLDAQPKPIRRGPQ